MTKTKNQITFTDYPDIEIVSGECCHAFPPHIHEHLCRGHITGGQAKLMMYGHATILKTGDSYIIPPYVSHSLSAIGGQKFQYRATCHKSAAPRANISETVLKAKAYIENTDGKFSLDVLAAAVNSSKYHLTRQFKEQLGIAPYQYYTHIRIKKIRQGLHLLQPLSDLAFNFYFTDQSHLCNTFKKYMGITPLQYIESYHLGG